VPSLYNNRAVDGSWCQLNWRLSSLGLEETWLEIQTKSSNRGHWRRTKCESKQWNPKKQMLAT
jgi:hypothetical protein